MTWRDGAFDSLTVLGDVVSDTFQVLSADNTSTSVTVEHPSRTNDAAVLSSASVNLDENCCGAEHRLVSWTISDVDSAASFVAQAGTARELRDVCDWRQRRGVELATRRTGRLTA